VPSNGANIEAFIRPRSVAIVGVSAREGSLAARLLRNLARYHYAGPLYAVNPKYEDVLGVPCYPCLGDIPSEVDLVLVLVRAGEVPTTLEQAAAVGARAAIIFSSGFSELGPEGAVAERELADLADETGMAVLGPNSQGLFHAPTGLAATFNPGVERELPEGPGLAFVGQSGAVGASFIDLARESGVGVSSLVSTGNQSQLGFVEICRELVEEDDVRILALYVESVPEYTPYVELLREARNRGKPVVVLRAGRSSSGRRAVASHTGAMLQEGEAFDLVTTAEGAVLVRDLDEFVFASSHALDRPTRTIDNIVVVTTSGGGGSLVADACEAAGFTLPVLPAEVRAALAEVVPAYGAVANPVDVTGQAVTPGGASCGDICRLVLPAPNVDALVFVLGMATGESANHIASDLVEKIRGSPKPVLVLWLAGRDQTAAGRAVFREAGVPVLGSFEAVTRMLRVLRDGAASAALRTPEPRDVDDRLRRDLTDILSRSRTITEASAGPFLDRLGIGRPDGGLARSAAEASAIAAELGEDLVAKIQHPGMIHKTEVGGVRFGIQPADAARTYEALASLLPAPDPGDGPTGVLFQRTAPSGGQELLVGLTASNQGFPHLVTVGMGGVAAELYRDIATRPAPVSIPRALEMLLSLRGSPLLTGFRGSEPLDLDAAAAAIAALSRAVESVGDIIEEVEINPLRVYPQSTGPGAVALDFLLTKRGEGAPEGRPAATDVRSEA
jgi:acyl-CoA synthetase (NDP forming)